MSNRQRSTPSKATTLKSLDFALRSGCEIKAATPQAQISDVDYRSMKCFFDAWVAQLFMQQPDLFIQGWDSGDPMVESQPGSYAGIDPVEFVAYFTACFLHQLKQFGSLIGTEAEKVVDLGQLLKTDLMVPGIIGQAFRSLANYQSEICQGQRQYDYSTEFHVNGPALSGDYVGNNILLGKCALPSMQGGGIKGVPILKKRPDGAAETYDFTETYDILLSAWCTQDNIKKVNAFISRFDPTAVPLKSIPKTTNSGEGFVKIYENGGQEYCLTSTIPDYEPTWAYALNFFKKADVTKPVQNTQPIPKHAVFSQQIQANFLDRYSQIVAGLVLLQRYKTVGVIDYKFWSKVNGRKTDNTITFKYASPLIILHKIMSALKGWTAQVNERAVEGNIQNFDVVSLFKTAVICLRALVVSKSNLTNPFFVQSPIKYATSARFGETPCVGAILGTLANFGLSLKGKTIICSTLGPGVVSKWYRFITEQMDPLLATLSQSIHLDINYPQYIISGAQMDAQQFSVGGIVYNPALVAALDAENSTWHPISQVGGMELLVEAMVNLADINSLWQPSENDGRQRQLGIVNMAHTVVNFNTSTQGRQKLKWLDADPPVNEITYPRITVQKIISEVGIYGRDFSMIKNLTLDVAEVANVPGFVGELPESAGCFVTNVSPSANALNDYEVLDELAGQKSGVLAQTYARNLERNHSEIKMMGLTLDAEQMPNECFIEAFLDQAEKLTKSVAKGSNQLMEGDIFGAVNTGAKYVGGLIEDVDKWMSSGFENTTKKNTQKNNTDSTQLDQRNKIIQREVNKIQYNQPRYVRPGPGSRPKTAPKQPKRAPKKTTAGMTRRPQQQSRTRVPQQSVVSGAKRGESDTVNITIHQDS